MALLKNALIFLTLIILLVLPASALTDLAYGKTAWANASLASTPADAVDGNIATAWFNVTTGIDWWGVDLNDSYDISYINIDAQGAGYTVWLRANGSNDNITYTPIYSNSSFLLSNPTPDIQVSERYRYINISIAGCCAILYEVHVYSETPDLLTPTNGSTQAMVFPPLTTDINFTWTESGGTGWDSNLLVSEDINFNLIEVDTTTSNNYSVQALEAGTHYWKVRYYNSTSGSYSNYSNYSYFTITSTTAATGT